MLPAGSTLHPLLGRYSACIDCPSPRVRQETQCLVWVRVLDGIRPSNHPQPDSPILSTSPAVNLPAWACCLCQPSITKRNHDPAWLGAHWAASQECPVSVEGHPRCRHQRQRLHLPLCVVSGYTHEHSMRQIHVSTSRRQVCALSGGFGPALILLGGTAFLSTRNL
jgi:hypothetical protein